MTDKLRNAFDGAWKSAETRSWIRGLLGKPNGDGTYTVAVPERAGHVFVRVSTQGGQSLTTARSSGRVPERGSLPVKMRLEDGGGYTVLEVDTGGYYEASTASDAPNAFGVMQHTHATDSGMSYLIEAQRMEPGLVHTAGGFTVTIEPMRYYYDSTWATYEGGTLSLSGNKPSTTGKHRLVVVCLNPATNTPTAVNGSEEDYATALTQADIDGISIGDTYPLGAVIVRNDDDDLLTQSKYIDARGWINYSDALAYNDAEGDPAAVTDTAADGTSDFPARRDHAHAYEFDNTIGDPATVGTTPAQGTSDWPARRDHIHGLANNVTTDAKLRDSGALSVIGRSANSTGDPADVSATPASDAVLRESGSTLGFGTVATGGLADSAATNAKLADMAESRIKGRGAGAGTGAPGDLSPVQVMAIVGGVLYIDNNGDGNVDADETTLSTYTIAADTLVGFATLHFEVVGSYAGNANSKTLRLYWGSNLFFDHTTTNASEFFTIQGRVVCIGDAAQKIWTHYFSNTEREYEHSAETEDSSFSIDFDVTGQATTTDDIIIETLLLTWTAPFV